MATKRLTIFGFGLLLCTGCASRDFDVYAKSDAKERVAVSIDLRESNGSNSQLFYAELNDGLEFRFRRTVLGKNPCVTAKFWVKDSSLEPLVVTLEPDRRVMLEIDVKDGRVELDREVKKIDKDEDDD